MDWDFLQKEGAYTVTVSVYPKRYDTPDCSQKDSFIINIIETSSLQLGFIGIQGKGSCYSSSLPEKIRAFANSREVRRSILGMFPIKELLALSYYKWNEKKYNYISGECNNQPAIERGRHTEGLLSDIRGLELIRANSEYDKMTAIVPRDYFDFHGIGSSVIGIVITPLWRAWRQIPLLKIWRWKSGFLGGSWNVTFVLESEVNKGTLAHELAHLLGQGKEFYKPASMCQRFKWSMIEPCESYIIPLALNAWVRNGRRTWKLIENKESIMGDDENQANNIIDIDDMWIDRETYQKTFKTLSKGAVISSRKELYEGETIVKFNKKKRTPYLCFRPSRQ